MTKPANSKQLVHVTVSTAVVAAVDLIAAQQFTTRSEFIRGHGPRVEKSWERALFARLPHRLRCSRTLVDDRDLLGSTSGEWPGADRQTP